MNFEATIFGFVVADMAGVDSQRALELGLLAGVADVPTVPAVFLAMIMAQAIGPQQTPPPTVVVRGPGPPPAPPPPPTSTISSTAPANSSDGSSTEPSRSPIVAPEVVVERADSKDASAHRHHPHKNKRHDHDD